MLLRIVPENRKTSCSIWPNFSAGIDLDLSDVDAVDQNLTLLELVVPADQERIVDFPEPVEPTNAIVSFGLTWNETPFNTHSPGI